MIEWIWNEQRKDNKEIKHSHKIPKLRKSNTVSNFDFRSTHNHSDTKNKHKYTKSQSRATHNTTAPLGVFLLGFRTGV